MYLIMEAVICYVSDNAGSNMLKKTFKLGYGRHVIFIACF